MTSLEKPDLVTTSVRWRWPSVHPDGRKFVVIAAVVTLVLLLFVWDELGWLMLGVTAWVAAFFRDPIRTTPRGPGLIVAPADGLGDLPMTRVSIFMSVFDVHINRTPIGGAIRRVVYISGKFLNADLDKASEDNERQHILVEDASGLRIGFTQIAGLVARRIVPFVKPGDIVAAGQRVGLIRFGSRVDVYLPAGTQPAICLGQRTIAGETVLARVGATERVTGVSQ